MNKDIINFWKKNAENIYWYKFSKKIFEFKNNFFKWYDDGKTNQALCSNKVFFFFVVGHLGDG